MLRQMICARQSQKAGKRCCAACRPTQTRTEKHTRRCTKSCSLARKILPTRCTQGWSLQSAPVLRNVSALSAFDLRHKSFIAALSVELPYDILRTCRTAAMLTGHCIPFGDLCPADMGPPKPLTMQTLAGANCSGFS